MSLPLSSQLPNLSCPEIRGGVWPGKIINTLKKCKLNIEFQIFFHFDILHQKIHSDIKMLYNFVINSNQKMFTQIFFKQSILSSEY